MTDPSPDIDGFEPQFLALESSASLPYSRFVYGTPSLTGRVQAILFERRVGEWVPPTGKLLTIEGQAAGMVACLTGAALRRARLAAVTALVRAGIVADPGVARRVQLAGTTLLKPANDDFYLSRIAVDEAFRGRRIGSALIDYVLEQAVQAHAPRCVLEVASDSPAAIALYYRCGFAEIERRIAEDPDTGRVLEYVHMQRQVVA